MTHHNLSRRTRLVSAKGEKGFTIIELTFAMSFLAFVLLFIAMSMIQMLRTYDKGLTLKQVNTAGTTISDDLTRLVRTAASTDDVITSHFDDGILCVGNVAYVWNPVYTGSPNKTYNGINRFNFDNGPVTLARWSVSNPQAPTSICNDTSSPPIVNHDGDNYSLLSPQARVIWAGLQRSSDGKLLKITFDIGTYDQNEDAALAANDFNDIAVTPYFAAAGDQYPTCRVGDAGNYCFSSSFVNTIYLPNAVK